MDLLSKKPKDGNDHVADQNLAADYFAEFPSEFPTTATMLGARQRRLPAWLLRYNVVVHVQGDNGGLRPRLG